MCKRSISSISINFQHVPACSNIDDDHDMQRSAQDFLTFHNCMTLHDISNWAMLWHLDRNPSFKSRAKPGESGYESAKLFSRCKQIQNGPGKHTLNKLSLVSLVQKKCMYCWSELSCEQGNRNARVFPDPVLQWKLQLDNSKRLKRTPFYYIYI